MVSEAGPDVPWKDGAQDPTFPWCDLPHLHRACLQLVTLVQASADAAPDARGDGVARQQLVVLLQLGRQWRLVLLVRCTQFIQRTFTRCSCVSVGTSCAELVASSIPMISTTSCCTSSACTNVRCQRRCCCAVPDKLTLQLGFRVHCSQMKRLRSAGSPLCSCGSTLPTPSI